MAFIKFLASAVLISLSGVMAPGPLTAVTVREGNKSPHAGAFIALGHGAVEIPLMILIFTCLTFLHDTVRTVSVQRIIGITGGIFLLIMGGFMLASLRKPQPEQIGTSSHTTWISGVSLSAANPYFLIWWATVGAALTLRSAEFGFLGFIIFACIHWMCDLSWYYLLSFLAYKGGTFFGNRFQKAVTAVCAAVLIYFGIVFVIG